MTAAFVLDCSVAMTWLFGDQATPQTAELLDRPAHPDGFGSGLVVH